MASYYDTASGQARLIPGAGVYLAEQNKAQSAYDRAVAQLKAQRAKRQITSGLGDDWNVDPNAQYGQYQAMLQGQGLQLQQAEESGQQRGFFGKGLGNQAESALRYGHAAEMLGFKNQLSDWENEYQMGMSDAMRAKNESSLASLGSAAYEGYSNEEYTPYGGPQIPLGTPVSGLSSLLGGRPAGGGVYAVNKGTPTKSKTKPTSRQTYLQNRLRAGRM